MWFFIILHIPSVGLSQSGSSDQLIFDHIGVTEGLSQSWAIAIVQDQDGFIWIGTRDGLNRYDGRNFKVYRSDSQDSTTLSSNHITTLFIDSESRIWVGTVEGLNLYRKEKDNFERIRISGDTSASTIHVNDIEEGKDRLMWITAYEGLFQCDYEAVREMEQIFSSDDGQLDVRMKAALQDSEKSLWIGVEEGMILLDLSKGNRIIQTLIELPKTNGPVGLVNDIVEYPVGVLWIATEIGGFFRFDRESGEFKHFLDENSGLISNHVRKLMLDAEKDELWIGTRNGLDVFRITDQSFRNFQLDIDDPGSLSDNSIHAIYKDKDGSVWLGTYSSGVNIHSQSFFKITTYKTTPGNKGLSNATVSAINETEPGRILIGTEGGGMNLYDRYTGIYTYFTKNEAEKNGLPHNNIKCIYKDVDGLFWIGSSGGGVSAFDPRSGTFKKFSKEEIGVPAEDGWVYSIAEDHNGLLWFGLFEGGLHWLDKRKMEFGSFAPPDGSDIRFEEIRKVFVDSKNRIWAGTDKGLIVCDQEQKSIRSFSENQADPKSLRSAIIYAIYEDSSGSLWFGTLGGGLSNYDEASDTFISYQIEDGLPGNNIFGILEDETGNLWLSTNRGISKFNPQSQIFKNYTTKDGFLDTEYGYNAYYKSQDGELFFGGRNGLVSFYPEAIKENIAVPPVAITDLRLFNRSVTAGDESGILKNQIGKTDKITLDHNQNVFSIGFSVLNYVKSTKNQFAYRLDGLEEEWNYVEAPTATYTNLKPGTYTFLAKGANNDGYWNSEPASLTITVLPAPWKTFWAYIGYGLTFTTALVVLIRYQKIKATLERDLRIREFEDKRQKELNNAKFKFFTDISHEIRTPLTLMLTPIEDMISSYRSEPKLYKQLLMVKSNADRLLRLVNQLLDFRKRESGKARLKAAEGNFIKFIKEISLAFLEQARKRNIHYRFIADTDELSLYFDRDEMEKVFFNLISNAFKYTPDSETIEIVVSPMEKFRFEESNDFEDAVKIEIRDSGIGINSEDVENIFERYYEADHSGISSLSTGIGLSLSKSIIKAHKGQITCQSTKGVEGKKNSTVFTVHLRLGKSHLQPDDLIENFKDSEHLDKYLELLSDEDQLRVTVPRIESTAGHTLLIVEDNNEIRSFLVDQLGKNYQVKEAVNGKEALEVAFETIPDLVISDVVMPEMDGIQLCSRLKNDERTSHVPVIILTARTSLIHKVEGIDSGADEYIIKPFSMEALKAKIRNLIESRELLRKKYSQEITLQPENIVITDPDAKFLQRAKDLLEAHISDFDFNVHQFIREIGMSRPVLYRKIKAITNLSIFDFINNYRLNKAATLLKTGHFNVSEIAFQVGFSDPKYFSKAFRKKFGMTPTDFLADVGEKQPVVAGQEGS